MKHPANDNGKIVFGYVQATTPDEAMACQILAEAFLHFVVDGITLDQYHARRYLEILQDDCDSRSFARGLYIAMQLLDDYE